MTALADRIRRTIVDESKRAGVGHIGSALSIADLVAALYSGALLREDEDGPERDRLVLSKGHAALALYAALAETGVIERARLTTYCGDGSLLGGHPEPALAGVDFATGSLGQGLSLATGAALAARLQGSQRRAFVLLSDAECNEGSVWEAAMFAGHHRLGNLVAIVDVNGQQALARTRDVLDQEHLLERWHAFGWEAIEVDGHDVPLLTGLLSRPAPDAPARPRVLLAQTVFGKGVSFMERRIEWHYLPLDDRQHAQAVAELDGAAAL